MMILTVAGVKAMKIPYTSSSSSLRQFWTLRRWAPSHMKRARSPIAPVFTAQTLPIFRNGGIGNHNSINNNGRKYSVQQWPSSLQASRIKEDDVYRAHIIHPDDFTPWDLDYLCFQQPPWIERSYPHLAWTQGFGRRSPSEDARLHALAQLSPGAEGYFDVSHISVPNVTIVNSVASARRVLKRLAALPRDTIHACDTEVMGIDLKEVGPVGNGYVTCVSVYSGPEVDYGEGKGKMLWIDNLDGAFGVLNEFKEWFEDESVKKVWHNYGFDRHVMWNEGIDCKGFAGDTMHMARLEDTSRSKLASGGGYSLEALTHSLIKERKQPMKELFGIPRLRKDGSEGSIVDIPPVETLQRDPRFRKNWILYSAKDAKSTWNLREELEKRLRKINWLDNESLFDYYQQYMVHFGEVLTDMERRGIRVNAKDYLAKVEIQAREDRERHVRTFRSWAASLIGPDGLALNTGSSAQLQTFLFGGSTNPKTMETTEEVRVFKVDREEVPEEALRAYEDRDREMEITNETPEDKIDKMNVAQLKTLCKENNLKVSGKKSELQSRLREHYLNLGPDDIYSQMTDDDLRQTLNVRSLPSDGERDKLLARIRKDVQFVQDCTKSLAEHANLSEEKMKRLAIQLERAEESDGSMKEILEDVKEREEKKKKWVELTIKSIRMTPEKYTTGGSPSVTADVLASLAGDPFSDPPRYGKAYQFFRGGSQGHDACVALYSLTAIGSIDTMIANFLTTLQDLVDERSRVHCSLNLNTETGRLSSRRPNLQNQPALEKDKYKIRQAFEASPGNNLIVADYGQLELRLLASMTNCQSMIEAFNAGGDFHSRTAMGMFKYIKDKVDQGEILFEWDYSKGDPPKPLLKDQYASERRKAKVLNFSIAYGKTAHGLTKDWGVTIEEAQNTLQAWYDSRPEVLEWQKNTKEVAKKEGITRTLMGRYRQIPDAMSKNRGKAGQGERAAINTPIQGGAADVAMMAMIKINNNERLKELGWILLMQIHDEVILEGPEDTAEEAFDIVRECMEKPWVKGLEQTRVPLLVDGSWTHKNWYDAK